MTNQQNQHRSSDGSDGDSPPAPKRRPLRRWRARLLALAMGLLVAGLIFECYARWFSPFDVRMKGDRLALAVNRTIVIHNDRIEKVASEIVHRKNSLGFRGPEPPQDLSQRMSVIAVGGSTTECFYLNDEHAWTQRLQDRLAVDVPDIWVNNAGLDGHSTFGHLVLMDHVIAVRPNFALFLVGINDLGIGQANTNDLHLRRNRDDRGPLARAYFWLARNSAACALVDNWRMQRLAQASGLVHQNINHAELRLAERSGAEGQRSDNMIRRELQRHRKLLPAYRQRLRQLIAICRQSSIAPVLITQPALYGPATDDVTGVDLSKVLVTSDCNGAEQWELLELYNQATRDVGRATAVPVVDLARTMPKSSRYFYDYHHFTADGADKVAEILASDSSRWLNPSR